MERACQASPIRALPTKTRNAGAFSLSVSFFLRDFFCEKRAWTSLTIRLASSSRTASARVRGPSPTMTLISTTLRESRARRVA